MQMCMDTVNAHEVLFAWLSQALFPVLLTMAIPLVLSLRQRFPLLDRLIPPSIRAVMVRWVIAGGAPRLLGHTKAHKRIFSGFW